MLIECTQMQGDTKPSTNLPLFLQPTLQECKSVFSYPKNLPPPRHHDHAIILKEGVNPVSVRPYRYP